MGTFIADLVLQILSFVAEKERENIKKRQSEGISAAKRRGVRFGRPPKEVPPFFAEVVNACESGEITLTEALERCNMGSSTFYRRLYEFRMKNPADH